MTATSGFDSYCIALLAQAAARALTRRLDAALVEEELTSAKVHVMECLDQLEEPLIGEVAVALSMDRTTLTAHLKPLQLRGFVEVAADPNDRRARRLRLTQAGRTVLAPATKILEQTQTAITRDLGMDLDVICGGLRRLAHLPTTAGELRPLA